MSRCWEGTELVAEDDGGHRMDDDEQPERENDRVDVRRAVDESDDESLRQGSQEQAAQERDPESDPVRVAGVDDDQCHVRGDHGHRGLCKVDDAGRSPDEYEGERERGVDHACGHAVDEDGEQLLHCGWRPFGLL